MGTQRKIVITLIAFIFVSFFLSFPFSVSATLPSSLNIRRVWIEDGNKKLFVFLDCLDAGRSIRPQEGDLNKFAAILDNKSLDVKADFSGDKNTIVFLIDVSNTLNPNSFSLVKHGVRKWIDKMKHGDQAAIISFGSRTEILSDFTDDIKYLRETLDGIEQINKKIDDPPDSCLYQAVFDGMSMCNRKDTNLPERRVIIAFTSGVRTSGGATQETLRKNIISHNHTPIYAILFGYAGNDIHEGQITQTSLRNQFIDIARESGGLADTYMGASNEDELGKVMEEHFARFDNLIKVDVDISFIELAEGGESNLEIVWEDGTRKAADVKKIPFSIKPSIPVPTVKEVTVTPRVASTQKGKTQSFKAVVSGYGDFDQSVIWYVDGGHGSTAISNAGILTVDQDETVDTLNIRAVSKADVSKFGAAIITLTPNFNQMWLVIALSLCIVFAAGVLWYKKKKFSKEIITENESQSSAQTSITPKHEPQLPPAPEIVLTVIGDAVHARTYSVPFLGSVVIGRSSGKGVLTILGDEHISGKHCEIFARADRFMIRDLNSTNGTIVNGATISVDHPVTIDDGNIIIIGVTQLRVKLPHVLQTGEPPTKWMKHS